MLVYLSVTGAFSEADQLSLYNRLDYINGPMYLSVSKYTFFREIQHGMIKPLDFIHQDNMLSTPVDSKASHAEL